MFEVALAHLVPGFWGLEPVRHAHALYWGLALGLSGAFGLVLWRALRFAARRSLGVLLPLTVALSGLAVAPF